MKKIILVLFLLFVGNFSFGATPIDFIYINGSNTNDEKAYQGFVKGITKFHPTVKKGIEEDAFMQEHFLKNGQYAIEEKPSQYFWGYKSVEDLMTMREKGQLLNGVSPIFAYAFRNMFANMMHDALWVKNNYNMLPIVEELNAQIKEDKKQGKKVVLFGYSAGTFITFEYMLLRDPYINMSAMAKEHKFDADIQKIIAKNPRKNTCVSALLNTQLIEISTQSKVSPNKNKETFKKEYMNLNKATDKYCAPDDTVIGIVNYASPIPLFYSDITNTKTDYYKFMRMWYKDAVENGLFFLTVNFADDPLGFPNNVNYKNDEIEKFFNIKFKQQKGFFYDYSKELSFRTVVGAHTSYWNAKERFTKAIINGFKEGWNFQYGTEETK